MHGVTQSTWKLPLLSGFLLFMGYFTDLVIPNFTAFIPMLFWLDANPGATTRERLGSGLVFGVTCYALSLHWMYTMLEISSLAFLLYLFLTIVFGTGCAIAMAAAGWMRKWTGVSFAILLPVCWLPLEWARTWGDTALTADHIAHAAAKFPFLVQFADLLGPYGVGALVLAVNGLLYETMCRGKRANRRSVAALIMLAVAVLGYDMWAWNQDFSGERTVRVAIIQPNIPLDVKMAPGTAEAQWQILERLSEQAAGEEPDLIVWPESASPYPLYQLAMAEATYCMPEVQQLARRLGISMLVGAEYYRIKGDDDHDLYNAAFAVHKDGSLDKTWAAKIFLVPFVEQVPWKPLLGWLLKDRGGGWKWLSGGFDPPEKVTVLPFREVSVGVLVCYEELYPELARALRNDGAGIQAVITNDAWFGRSLFQRYQADILRMRAIENRTAFVRAANTGISGFIDPRGRYLEMGGLFEESVMVADLPVTTVRTVYDRIGDVVAWLAIAGCVAMIVITVRKKRMVREPEQ